MRIIIVSLLFFALSGLSYAADNESRSTVSLFGISNSECSTFLSSAATKNSMFIAAAKENINGFFTANNLFLANNNDSHTNVGSSYSADDRLKFVLSYCEKHRTKKVWLAEHAIFGYMFNHRDDLLDAR